MPGRTISPSIIQATIAGNKGDTRGGGADNFENSFLDLSNTLIYWNNLGLGGGPTMTYTARYSLILGSSLFRYAGAVSGSVPCNRQPSQGIPAL